MVTSSHGAFKRVNTLTLQKGKTIPLAMRKFGLMSENRELVPLKDVSVEIQISGFVAHVVASLQYENNEDTPIEVEFFFPLDDGSAVYKFEAVIEDKHIVAECQENEEVRKIYDDANAAGNTTMQLEPDDSTGNIFRCVMGNLPPKTHVKLVIGYVIELPVENDGKLRFTLPVIFNPRYSPNVDGLESAKGATYVLQQKDIPYSFKLSAMVNGPKQIKSVTASQHHIVVEQGENNKTANVTFTDEFTFDSDVRLYVEYENPYEAECVVEKGNSETAGFLAESVLMLNLLTKIDTTGSTNKGEYIFLLDRSWCMGHARIKRAIEAIILFLKKLPVGCYFNIVSFGSSHEFLFTSGSKKSTKTSINAALDQLKVMEADLGLTEILRPLEAIYAKSFIQGQPRQIFLLTGGLVRNEKAVIDIVKKNASNTRVFSIGIGELVSTALVNGVARWGNGKAEFIKDSEGMQPKVDSLLKFATQPSITDVTIDWELPSGVNVITMPEIPPFLFNGDRLILYALLQGYKESQISGKVLINGKTDKGPANFSANFFDDQSTEVSSFAPLHRLAAKAQIKLLEKKENGSDEIKSQIIALSVGTNITSSHTSFVAIDKDTKEAVIRKHVRRNVPVTADMQLYRRRREHMRSTLVYKEYTFSSVGRRTRSAPFRPPTRNLLQTPSQPQRAKQSPEKGIFGRLFSFGKSPKEAPSPNPREKQPEQMGIFGGIFSFFKSPKEGIFGRLFSFGKSTEKEQVVSAHPEMAIEIDPQADIAHTKPMSDDPMINMVSLQGFRGNWTLSKDVCDILKVEIKALKELNLSQFDDILATLVVLVWLDLNFNSRHDEWEMLETKAKVWLMKEGLGEAIVRDTKKSILDALGSRMKV